MRHEPNGHIAWIDHAKGICIVLVVMLYAVGLTGRAAGGEGWLHAVEQFARPFRMPDFFLVSGLLLARAIGRDWLAYLDRKVVHFAYFYVLWLTLLLAFESRWLVDDVGWTGVAAAYARAMVHPYSMLWFIYLLPLFFVVTKLARGVSAPLVWLLAAAVQIAHPETGVKVLDKFAGYYVFFYSGFLCAPLIFRLAARAAAHCGRTLAALGIWALLNGYLAASEYAFLPGVSLAAGLVGAVAVTLFASLICTSWAFAALGYCGRHSIAIYLAFLVPMTVTHKLASYSGISDVGTLSLLATLGGVGGALLLRRLLTGTRLRFLFERPAWFSVETARKYLRAWRAAAATRS